MLQACRDQLIKVHRSDCLSWTVFLEILARLAALDSWTMSHWSNYSSLSLVTRCTMILYCRGGEPIYYHGPHEFCIIAGGPQNQLILS